MSQGTDDGRIRVAGVGGAGGNAINRMVAGGMQHVEFIAFNTDAQALTQVQAHTRIHLGEISTRGLGAGGDPARKPAKRAWTSSVTRWRDQTSFSSRSASVVALVQALVRLWRAWRSKAARWWSAS
jgi:hypothetical protein